MESYLPRNRDDFYFKLRYARGLVTNSVDTWAKVCYFESLFFWNHFLEKDVRTTKKNPQDFEDAFHRLQISLRQTGLDKSLIPPADFKNGLGSHRLAALIAIHQVKGNAWDLEDIGWRDNVNTFGFFNSLGLAPPVIRDAVIEKINFCRERPVQILLIWPRAQEFKPDILKRLSGEEFPTELLVIESSLTEQGLRNLVATTYAPSENWAKNLRGIGAKFREVRDPESSKQTVTMVVLPAGDPQETVPLKSEIRKLWARAFQGIHTTDSAPEALRVFTALSSPFSLAQLDASAPKNHLNVLMRLTEACSELSSRATGAAAFAVVGSQWLDLLGIRKSADVDVVVSDLEIFNDAELTGLDIHNDYLDQFNVPSHELIYSPAMTTWVHGLRLWSPHIYADLMKSRGEQKDIAFLDAFREKIAKLESLAADHSKKLVFQSYKDGKLRTSSFWEAASNGPFGASKFAGVEKNWSLGSLEVSTQKLTRIVRQQLWKFKAIKTKALVASLESFQRVLRDSNSSALGDVLYRLIVGRELWSPLHRNPFLLKLAAEGQPLDPLRHIEPSPISLCINFTNEDVDILRHTIDLASKGVRNPIAEIYLLKTDGLLDSIDAKKCDPPEGAVSEILAKYPSARLIQVGDLLQETEYQKDQRASDFKNLTQLATLALIKSITTSGLLSLNARTWLLKTKTYLGKNGVQLVLLRSRVASDLREKSSWSSRAVSEQQLALSTDVVVLQKKFATENNLDPKIYHAQEHGSQMGRPSLIDSPYDLYLANLIRQPEVPWSLGSDSHRKVSTLFAEENAEQRTISEIRRLLPGLCSVSLTS